jgi:dolichol-phosphate mannosyltransferase
VVDGTESEATPSGANRTGTPRLSAIIACHRDAPAVPFMHERLTTMFVELGVDYEIIFVNDGSPDNAREVLAELAGRDRHVTVITHSRAFGSQSAFTSGMRVATGDAVVLLDGDLQDPPELIPAMVEKWREGFDVVYGERVDREASGPMRFAYKAFYRAFRKASYVNVPLDAGDFGLLDRRVVDTLNQLPEKDRFMRGLRAWVGFRQVGVPYVRPERMFGTTTNSFVKNLGWARRAILSFSYAPLDFIAWLALTTVALSVVAMCAQVVARIAFPDAAPRGVTTLLIVILFIGGVQFLCFSIIGSYLAHMYDEVKARPSYVVEEILNPPAERGAAGAGPPRARPAPSERQPAVGHDGGSKRVLVTGAGGFVGANLVRRLVEDGHRVTALARPGGTAWRLEGLSDDVEVVEMDLLDGDQVAGAVDKVRPEWAFHLAAYGASSWQTDADLIMRTNLMATVRLVEACRDAGCEAVVHAGSSSEYGIKDHAPSESEVLEPNSDYGVSKSAATMFCRQVARRDGLRAVTLRLYSVYGPYEDPRRLVPRLASHGLRGELPPLVSPTIARDFVAVDDVVDAFVLAAARGTPEAGAVYNVGSGVQTSIAQLVALARRVLDVEVEPDWASMPPRIWDTDTWVADSRRIRDDLGWAPRIGLEEGFTRTAEWLLENRRLWPVYDVRPGSRSSLAGPRVR